MIHIRALRREDDFRDLIALSREFFREYEAHHQDFFKIDHLRDQDIVDYFCRWIDNPSGAAFIALAEGRIVGYVTVYVRDQAPYWRVKQVGDISGLMVHKDYRRRGIASQLLAHARAFLAERDVKYFMVYTAVENKGAIEFYQRSGLEPLYTTMMGKAEKSRSDGGTSTETSHVSANL